MRFVSDQFLIEIFIILRGKVMITIDQSWFLFPEWKRFEYIAEELQKKNLKQKG